jgi:site-specific DNA-methyltransferase (adenine-specific)
MNWNGLELPANPYYSDDAVIIYHGDCREILPQLSDNSVDLAWTDPPYNVGKDYGGWDDAMSDKEYLAFCANWIALLKQKVRELAIYLPRKYAPEYWQMLGPGFVQVVFPWTPEGAIRNGLINQFASLLTNAKPKQRTKDVWLKVQMRGMGYYFKEKDYGHPGYMSEDLTSRVIMAFSNQGSLILDPFLGSGTTAYCAKKLGRKCIGIEIEEKYCEIAANRCRQSVMELKV